jgi:putative ABC transport system permease protein
VYKDINPNYPFSYQFVDEEYANMYQNEQIISTLSNCFAVIAIVISCLGLLGLVMLAIEQRTREFGIRKVLGATVSNIMRLLSGDFLTIITVAFAIAAPVAGYLMHHWLQLFAYRIVLSWEVFVIAGGVVVFIALLTICSQAFQSATMSPVKALKSE